MRTKIWFKGTKIIGVKTRIKQIYKSVWFLIKWFIYNQFKANMNRPWNNYFHIIFYVERLQLNHSSKANKTCKQTHTDPEWLKCYPQNWYGTMSGYLAPNILFVLEAVMENTSINILYFMYLISKKGKVSYNKNHTPHGKTHAKWSWTNRPNLEWN